MSGAGGWESSYCVACDVEYESSVSRCPECGVETLGLDDSAAGPERPALHLDAVSIPVGHLDSADLAFLRSLAEGSGTPFHLTREHLTVPAHAAEFGADLVAGFADSDHRAGATDAGSADVVHRVLKTWLRGARPLPGASRRLSAFLIDQFLTFAAVIAVLLTGGVDRLDEWWMWATVVAVYFGIRVVGRGTTPGKWLLGLRVEHYSATDHGPSGRRPGYGAAGLRAVVLAGTLTAPAPPTVASLVAAGVFVACVLPVLVTPDRRGLHDLLARTIVVNVAAADPAVD